MHGRAARRASPSVRSALGQDKGSRQGPVWCRVADYDAVLVPSLTGSLVDHLDGLAGVPGDAGVAILPGQRGVILGVGGHPLLMELFRLTPALVAHLPALLGAVRLDAALVPPVQIAQVPGRRTRRMARHLDGLPLSQASGGAGDGTAYPRTPAMPP